MISMLPCCQWPLVTTDLVKQMGVMNSVDVVVVVVAVFHWAIVLGVATLATTDQLFILVHTELCTNSRSSPPPQSILSFVLIQEVVLRHSPY